MAGGGVLQVTEAYLETERPDQLLSQRDASADLDTDAGALVDALDGIGEPKAA